MISAESQHTARLAQQLYDATLRSRLEREHPGKYLCIEPVSGEHFLGATFDDAVNAALDAYPDRLTHTLRIFHPAAIHLGVVKR